MTCETQMLAAGLIAAHTYVSAQFTTYRWITVLKKTALCKGRHS